MQIGFHFEKIHKEEITHTQIVRYAGASGDFNPIHTVVPFGEKAGLGGVIVHGMMIMGFIGQAVDTWCASNELVKFSTRFKAITRPGESITVSGLIVGETEHLWVCQAEAVNEHGEIKASAHFEVRK